MKTCVLIPAYNEEIVIQYTINSLLETGFDVADIYIVDDCSTDATAIIASNNNVNVCTTPTNGGKAKAQVYGIQFFALCDKYNYVMMVDSDTKVGTDFKDTMLISMISYPDVDLFVGQVTSSKADNIFSAYRAVEYTFSHDVIKKGQDNFNVVYVAPGCVSMYSTSILRHLKFDHTILAEDMDLTIQVHKLGGRIKYIHNAKVITQDPKTTKDYHNQLLRWYRGFWQVVNKHFERPSRWVGIDYYILYLIVDSLIMNRALVLLLSLIMVSNVAIVLGILIDFSVFVLVGIYAFHKTGRYDILYKLPVMYFLSFFSMYAYIRSFLEVIILRKNNFGWNKVKRYGEQNEEVHLRTTSPIDT